MTTPDIVLVGGAAEDADLWADVLELLDEGARVHTHPGHVGGSGALLGSVDEMAADLVAALAGEPVLLVGHSMGGAVAVTAALQAPARVAGVVVVASGARLPVNAALLDSLPDEFDAALPFVLMASTGGREAIPPESAHIAERMEAMVRRSGARVFATDLRACDGYDVREQLPALAVPMLVVAGERDRMTPPRLAEELTAAPGSTLTVLPGVAHQIPWEAPGALVEAIESFARLTAS